MVACILSSFINSNCVNKLVVVKSVVAVPLGKSCFSLICKNLLNSVAKYDYVNCWSSNDNIGFGTEALVVIAFCFLLNSLSSLGQSILFNTCSSLSLVNDVFPNLARDI